MGSRCLPSGRGKALSSTRITVRRKASASMFRKVLIANRGEIALRVISACKEMGIRTVAVYSEADGNSLHVRFADQAICIGPPKRSESYLNVPAVVAPPDIADVGASHPRFGMLGQDFNFAAVCRATASTFIGPPRYVEFQVLADEHGNVRSLGERECSIQRRHQRLIEEAPSLMVTPKLREELGKTIKKSLENIGYWNAGTIEFLMDEDGKIYFIEMNTRIQVEHCVTEMVTGIDLVKAQLRIAAGEKLPAIIPKPVEIRGHAIECRINAEHPEKFTPSAGKITAFNLPGGNGVRVDTLHYAEGGVPPYYDSLIAKLICHGAERVEARSKMERALSK